MVATTQLTRGYRRECVCCVVIFNISLPSSVKYLVLFFEPIDDKEHNIGDEDV